VSLGRAAYQLVLFRRAVLVDIRPEAQRRAEGERAWREAGLPLTP